MYEIITSYLFILFCHFVIQKKYFFKLLGTGTYLIIHKLTEIDRATLFVAKHEILSKFYEKLFLLHLTDDLIKFKVPRQIFALNQ